MLRRKTPLDRGTPPLARYSPLARRSPLATRVVAVAGKPRSRGKPSVPATVREILQERSGGACEIALPGCSGQGTDPAHRKGVKAGGRHGATRESHNQPSNVLWACRGCHDWCHHRPAEAYDLGLMLREHQDPAVEPVQYRSAGWVLLDDAGRAVDVCGPAEAEAA